MYLGLDRTKSHFEISPIFCKVVMRQLKVARPSMGSTELSVAAIISLAEGMWSPLETCRLLHSSVVGSRAGGPSYIGGTDVTVHHTQMLQSDGLLAED
jgi:hypothetical protein